MGPLLIGGLFDIGSKLIEKLFSSPEEKAKAQLELLRMQQAGELDQLKVQLSAILAEAQSSDPWTSRARPTFLYVIYVLLLTAIPFSIVWAIHPESADRMATGFGRWLDAIPEPLYALFGAGYLGYTAFRSWDKKGGTR